MFWLIEVGVFVVGLVLLQRGWRGRVVDGHPLCAKCGFDLIGSSLEGRCAECGSELGGVGGSRSVRHGHRTHRPRLLQVGAVLIVIAVAPFGLVVVASVRGTTIERFLPSWVLLWELKGDGTTADRAAALELLDRMGSGTLGSKDEDALIDRALNGFGGRDWSTRGEWAGMLELAAQAGSIPERQRGRILDWVLAKQADRLCPWDRRWGTLAEAILAAGDPADPRVAEYLKQATAPELVTLGSPPSFAVQPVVLAVKLASHYGDGLQLEVSEEALDLDGGAMRVRAPGTAANGITSQLLLGVARFIVGDHQVRARLRIRSTFYVFSSTPFRVPDQLIDVQHTIHVVPAMSREAANAHLRDQLKQFIEVSLSPTRYQINGQGWMKFEVGSGIGLGADTRIELDAFAKRGTAEASLGSFELVLGKTWSDFALRVNEAEFGSSPFDLVLSVKRLTIDADTVFDGPGTLDLVYPVNPADGR